MNRTRKLMSAVTTSLLFSGAMTGPIAVAHASAQTATQPDESWKQDPKVTEAANEMWRNWTMHCEYPDQVHPACAKGQAQEDVAKAFPQFDSALVQKALQQLVYRGLIMQLGHGTKDDPFCYCKGSSHG